MPKTITIVAVLIAALVAGSVTAAVASALFFWDPFVFWLAILPCLLSSVVVGLPVTVLFYARRWTGVLTALLGGFLIGLIPVAFTNPMGADWSDAELFLALGATGACGSGAYWLVLKCFGVIDRFGAKP